MRGKPPGTILCWEAFSVEVLWQGTVGKKERLLAARGTWKRLGKATGAQCAPPTDSWEGFAEGRGGASGEARSPG